MFNEYLDILEEGSVFFLDEENLYNLMTEELNVDGNGNFYNTSNNSGGNSNSQPKVPANGLNNNANNSANQQASGNNQQQQQAKAKGRSLLQWFNDQRKAITNWGSKQVDNIRGKFDEITGKMKNLPEVNENDDQEVEVPTGNAPQPPKLDTSKLNDPQSAEAEAKRYAEAKQEYDRQVAEMSKKKKFIKGASKIIFLNWAFKQARKVSADVQVNLKEGTFALGVGARAASRASAGDSFGSALGHVIKNIFLAILVVIGGIFKVLKIYFGAIFNVFGTIFKTVGDAGATLVTGQMPSQRRQQ